jgi:glycerophosphoryl diester phosphodiesterase
MTPDATLPVTVAFSGELLRPWWVLLLRRAAGVKLFLFFFSVVMIQMVAGKDLDEESGFLVNGVTAHRGNTGVDPENTLRAFRSALEVGVDWMECDIFMTSDGRIVVIHDSNTERVGDRNLVVADSTYDQLQQVDVAFQFRRRAGKSLSECPEATAPLLEEVIRLTMTQRRTRLSIQPKMDIVDEAIELIREMKAESWVGFNEGSFDRVRRVKELAPEILVFYDTDGNDTELHVDRAIKHGFEGLVMRHDNITVDDIEIIHAAGLEAGAWTVNQEEEMKRLKGMGVDRIYTDRPGLLLSLYGVPGP